MFRLVDDDIPLTVTTQIEIDAGGDVREETIGPVLMGGYGQTECPASIAYLPPDEHFVDGRIAADTRLSSVGRPNPLVNVEIMDDAVSIALTRVQI